VDGRVIQARDLCLTGVPLAGDFQLHLPGQRVITMDFDDEGPTLEEVEQAILLAAYEHKGHNLSQAARTLGITREALRYRLNKMTEAPESES
jgi:DNA-binding NtrC family response regulator